MRWDMAGSSRREGHSGGGRAAGLDDNARLKGGKVDTRRQSVSQSDSRGGDHAHAIISPASGVIRNT